MSDPVTEGTNHRNVRPEPPRRPGQGSSGTTPDGDGREPFGAAVTRVLQGLEPGDVLAYGEVAAEAGHPGAARAVGTFLRDSDGLCWWRVVRADGRLASGKVTEQARRLRAEGVEVRNGRVVSRRLRRDGDRSGPPPPGSGPRDGPA